MNATSHSFGKKHRLSSRTLIERLFAEGQSFFAYPFRCIWLVAEWDPARETAPVQVLVSVSKRNHKRAVVRNLLKRRIREAYRLNRHLLDGLPLPGEKRLVLALVYSSKEVLDYSALSHGVIQSISKIQKKIAASRDISVCPAD